MLKIDCTKQAKKYFRSFKDSWCDADFSDLRPLANEFEMNFTIPSKIRYAGCMYDFALGNHVAEGYFISDYVKKNQVIQGHITSPIDGWYVQATVEVVNYLYQFYYFCNNNGKIHNAWPEKSSSGMVLVFNENDPNFQDNGYRDFIPMITHIFCLGITKYHINIGR